MAKSENDTWSKITAWTSLMFTGKLRRSREQVVKDLKFGSGQRESAENCVFRKFTREGKAETDILIKNDVCMVIRDKYPTAEIHLLVLPLEPIRSILSLEYTEHDAQLLEIMIKSGKEAMKLIGAPGDETTWMLGFHVPPMTSQDHLHLHCCSGKFTSMGKMKFENNRNFYVHAQDCYDHIRRKIDEKNEPHHNKNKSGVIAIP